MNESPRTDSEADSRLRELLQKEHGNAKKWAPWYRKMWSFATHTATTLVIVLSASAAICASFSGELWWLKWAATILSGTVTIIASLKSQIGFERKWTTFRLVNTAVEFLEIDLLSGRKSPEEIRVALEALYKEHNVAVLGAALRSED